ncbi:MAG: tetratricopeptide repeat protein [Janthinobacterium lividum]
MGFVALLGLGLAAAALLWRLRIARPLWSLVGAAMMLGATGYALQGRPALPGHPTEADAKAIEVDPGLVMLREDMFGRFTADAAYMTASDAMLRSGDAGAAVQVMLGGIRQYPGSIQLWTGLGTALVAHDGDQVSPPALLAFQQATRLSPRHPGPPFFTGLAYVRAGRFAEARPYWRRALALSPADAPYRAPITVRLALLDVYLDRMRTTGR